MTGRVAIGLVFLFGWGILSAVRTGDLLCADDGDSSRPAIAIQEVQVGVGGSYKAGCWTPVRVTLSGAPGPVAGRVEIEVADSDGVPVAFRRDDETPLVVPASGRATLTFYGRFGRLRNELQVTVRGADRALASRKFNTSDVARCWPPGQLLFVELGNSWNAAEGIRSLEHDSQTVTLATLKSPAEMPDSWYGWESVDAVLLSTSRPDFVEEMPHAQFVALDRWLRLGGRLIWSVGRRGDVVLADDSRFAAWSPGKFVEVGALRRSSALESYAGAARRLELEDADGRPLRLPMTFLDEVRGRVEAPEGGLSGGDRPLVIRYPLGLGQASLVTLDMDEPPMSTWTERSRVVARVAQRGRERTTEIHKEQLGQITHLGFDDLAGQLRGALDQYAGVTLVSFSWVAALLVLYIVLIGPGDFFLLRFLGRPHWTWATLGIVIAAFVFLAYGLSARWKDRRLRINQVQVVDVDLDGAISRGTAWFNVYSPHSDRFNLSLRRPAGDAPGESLLAWQGLPGKGLGGLAATTVATTVDDAYRIELGAAGAELAGLPIQVGGTKSLAGRWWHASRFESDANRLHAVSLDEQLQGECVYPLSTSLSDWFLIYGNWLYRGDRRLEPGDTIALSDFPVTRYLDWHLTRRSVSAEHKDVSTPWDQADLDVPRIVEMMLFHDAAGGRTYSRLQHRYQAYLDLSDHLRTGRAILVGRVERPVADLLRDGQPLDDHLESQWTFCRVVYPVKIRKPTPTGVRPTGS